MLKVVPDLLLIDCVGHLCGVAEEVEISANCTLDSTAICARTECIIIHVITGFLELVGQSIVGVVKVEPGSRSACLHLTVAREPVLLVIPSLEGLQLARLGNTRERIIVLEHALVGAGLLPWETCVEAEERHLCRSRGAGTVKSFKPWHSRWFGR